MTDADRAKAYSAALAIQKQVDTLVESLEPLLILTHREFSAMQKRFIENGGSWGNNAPTRFNGYRFYVDLSIADVVPDNMLLVSVDEKARVLSDAEKEIATDEY